MNLQSFYELKERLEQAAIAGTGLLAEDFRLQRAAEGLKPLAAASPVFAKMDAGLQGLLAAPAEDRAGRLLDLLALVDAVAYTQGKTGAEGDLEPLPPGGGAYQELSYSQLHPLLEALTGTGGGRMNLVQETWENHPEFFGDYRILPALVSGLGEGYAELAVLNAKILESLGPLALPLLKQGFDPEGKRDMVRRVEVIAAIAGADATPWLQEILPEAKKDVRTAVLLALGADQTNAGMLLELARIERGKNREAVLESLAKLDGEAVRKFWSIELRTRSNSVKFLRNNDTDWAAELVAAGLWERTEKLLSSGACVPAKDSEDFNVWCGAIGKKSSHALLQFWRWACGRMEAIDGLKAENDKPLFAGVSLTDSLLHTLCANGPGPLCEFCLTLREKYPDMTRFVIPSFLAAVLSRPAAEVYETYAPLIPTEEPGGDKQETERRKTLNTVLLRALNKIRWHSINGGQYIMEYGKPAFEPLDPRWISRLTQAVWKVSTEGTRYFSNSGMGEVVDSFDAHLAYLVDPGNPEMCAAAVPYLREQAVKTGRWNTYSRWLLRFGSSPRGILKDSMCAKKASPSYLYYLWELLRDAAKVLPADEVIALLDEIRDAANIRGTKEREIAKAAIPWTMEQLRQGRPFPEWDQWWKILQV